MLRLVLGVTLTVLMTKIASACPFSVTGFRYLSDTCIRLDAHEVDGVRFLEGFPRTLQKGNVAISDYRELYLIAPDCTFRTPDGSETGRMVTTSDGFSLQFSLGSELGFPDQKAPWSDVLDCTQQ